MKFGEIQKFKKVWRNSVKFSEMRRNAAKFRNSKKITAVTVFINLGRITEVYNTLEIKKDCALFSWAGAVGSKVCVVTWETV